MASQPLSKTIVLTGLALTAFAANSVLCRLALGSGAIDASSFTGVRLLSGSAVLLLILAARRAPLPTLSKGSWAASLMLFVYAIAFSYAYNSLDTGTGALILFGSVQITMILASLISGNSLRPTEWLGVTVAFSGFVYLVLPGVSVPPTLGFLQMALAGIAWGLYTLKGQGSRSPLADTAFNFLRTTPLILLMTLTTLDSHHYTSRGLILAVISGGITSGIGYTIWYVALAGLSATRAAVLQLAVPVIAALGGVLFVSEEITLRLAISTAMVLGGILAVVMGRGRVSRRQ